jgi:thiol-disulfide isomerase/thioredoxin
MKKSLFIAALMFVAVAGTASALYVTNRPPVVAPIPTSESQRGDKPYVVKIHAQWCPKCMMTKSVWSEIEETYAGRVHLLVLDFTDQHTTEASEAEARRLGLAAFLESMAGTGSIVVLDAATRAVTASVSGSREFEDYAAAIDAALEHPRSDPAVGSID